MKNSFLGESLKWGALLNVKFLFCQGFSLEKIIETSRENLKTNQRYSGGRIYIVFFN